MTIRLKLQGKQHAKGRGRIVFMLLCFIIALVIMMMYSSKYFIALMVPVFYLLIRLKNTASEKNYLTDGICTVVSDDSGMTLAIESLQPKLCNTYRISYANIDTFSVGERKVSIYYADSNDVNAETKTIEFFIRSEDKAFWEELAENVGR